MRLRRCSVAIMVLATRFTELSGCRVPIQQAPMGPVSTSALAVAVADAGGLGSITALGLTAAQLDKILASMTARTTRMLAANFLTAQIDPGSRGRGPRAGRRLLLGATVPRARVLRSCVHALRDLTDDTVGETTAGGQRSPCPKVTGNRRVRPPPGISARCPCTRASPPRPSPPSSRSRSRSSSLGARSPHIRLGWTSQDGRR